MMSLSVQLSLKRKKLLIKNKDIIAHHRKKIKEWFINLFCGNYDMSYFMYLYKIGEIHVKIGLPTQSYFPNGALLS